MIGQILASAACLFATAISAKPLTSSAGESAVLAGWDLQSTSDVSNNLASLSKPGLDVSSWHHTDASRCTIMGCLLDAGLYKDSELWYSDNLNHFNWGQFSVPWLYRTETTLTKPSAGQHFLLLTNGITSKADLFFNGHQIAEAEHQAGAFGGHTYDITKLVGNDNALLVQVYPTNYNYDLAVGFVDWNPYPPDNGTGVWRDVVVKQTGPVAMGPVSVTTHLDDPVEHSPAVVTVHVKTQNLESHAVEVEAEAVITEPGADGKQQHKLKKTVKLGPRQTREVKLTTTLNKPQIWWPKLWGSQPMYTASVSVSVDSELSDASKESFGIRKVTSHVNAHNDTQFTLNGHPFQVLGGGYGADMFLRWDADRFTSIAKYMLHMGLNTIRLEGMTEHPELYQIADQLGLMVIAGWECCTKWEAWEYNHDLAIDPVPYWDEHDYDVANASMVHESSMMQTHPSMLAFFVGSDFWPNDRATDIYLAALEANNWQTPIIASAAKRGFPAALGPSGMKMDGPYDWVPPNYWYDTEPSADRLGAAFGFGSELGAGVGTPEMGSLKQFLSESDMEDLWTKPDKGLFHMSNNVSSFYDRKIYNDALYARYGEPSSLDDYLVKAQMMDYEATRSQYEGYSARWNADRPATGIIYWMLNNAWPSLHWNQFDHYLHPAGSYFGTKVGSRAEHVAYDYVRRSVWLINHSLARQGKRNVDIEVMDLGGKVLSTQTIHTDTTGNKAVKMADVKGLQKAKDVVFLRLVLSDQHGKVLSRNVYWVPRSVDALSWDDSTWFYTPVTKYADLTSLSKMDTATVSVKASMSTCKPSSPNSSTHTVKLENKSSVPAVFVRLTLVDDQGEDVNPVLWSDNYVTLWPGEKMKLQVTGDGRGAKVQVSGRNVEGMTIEL